MSSFSDPSIMYGLYVVTCCKATTPRLEEPGEGSGRLPWHEVTKVAHYTLSVDALKHP